MATRKRSTRSGQLPRATKTPSATLDVRALLGEFLARSVGTGTTTRKLASAFRAVVRELTRQQPGRAQKGAVDAALRSVTPHIRKALRP